MSRLDEQLTEQFRQWERRGRGWQVFDEPVCHEPPFRPFHGHYLPESPPMDDGRRQTSLGSFIQRLSRSLSTAQPPPLVIPEVDEEPEPKPLIRDSLIELQTSLPANLNISREAFEQFLLNLSLCREPISFELLGLPQKITAQFATHSDDAPLVRRQLQAHFPEAVFQTVEGLLEQSWDACEGDDMLAVEFGLEREFMLPLATGKLDPFIGIVGALAELQPDELALFQVLFQPVHHPWSESVLRSVTHADGKPFFVNAPELTDAAKTKIARPLYATVVRMMMRTARQERTLQLARDLAASLRVFAHPNGNALIPLTNDEYPFEEHIEDVLRRQSRRSGMLLNSDELTGFVHLPSSAVRSAKLRGEIRKTKSAPAIVRQADGVLLGNNVHAGQSVPVRLTPDQRVKHCHIIGASGTGKSTLLFNLIQQDIENGEGVAVLDPHGDLIERILGIIPPERIDDVVLVDASDEEFSVGFNILSAHSDFEKNLLASDLVSVFARLSTSWGDQMGSVLQNAILAFLESDRGGTLADLRRFLIDVPYRNEFLKTVRDPDVVFYWQKAFPQLTGNRSLGPVLTRLETFLAPKPIRYMVSQPVNRLDFADILDTGKIFLAKLPQGQMGKENAFLLGSLLVSKFQQLAMSRQRMSEAQRRNFWLYIDEFQNFITPSMAEILSGARKYRLGLILAHQELRQLQRDSEVAGAVLSNPYARIVFRVGDEDARKLSDGFGSFEARDLQNLGTGEAIARVERSDFDFNLTIPLPDEPNPITAAEVRNRIITASREKYALPRAEIEAALLRQLQTIESDRTSEKPRLKRERPRPDAVEPTATAVPLPPIPEVISPVPSVEKPPAKPEHQEPSVPESKPAEVQNVTVSEKKEAPATPEPIVVREALPPRDLGRGGAQHKAIQKRVKNLAEDLGFRGTIEKEVLEGRGSVDLLLERDDRTIACEISITTTIDHEVGNVVKCIKAGFSNIAVICPNEVHLGKIKAAVSGSLGPEVTARVSFYHPDQFIAHLESLPLPVLKTPDTVKVRRGFRVKRSPSKLAPDEQRQREDVVIRSIAEAMQRKVK